MGRMDGCSSAEAKIGRTMVSFSPREWYTRVLQESGYTVCRVGGPRHTKPNPGSGGDWVYRDPSGSVIDSFSPFQLTRRTRSFEGSKVAAKLFANILRPRLGDRLQAFEQTPAQKFARIDDDPPDDESLAFQRPLGSFRVGFPGIEGVVQFISVGKDLPQPMPVLRTVPAQPDGRWSCHICSPEHRG
jgi:hypothetical protein